MRLLALAMLVMTLTPVRSQDNRAVDSNHAGQPQNGQQRTQPGSGIAQADAANKSNSKRTQDTQTSPGERSFEGWSLGLTLVIALAAAVQAGTAIWQARVYERQYDIMSKALIASNKNADAALQGVVALEKLERPFLMIELRGEIKDEVWIVNKGKVPAQILWYNPSGSLIMKTHEEMENLLPDFHYGFLHDAEGAQIINVPWIAPEGEMKLCQFEWIALASELTHAYQTGQKFALLLSTVKYRGMLTDKVYESRWCFRWLGKNHGLKLDGPFGYNSYT